MAAGTGIGPELLGGGRRMLQREAARWWWVPLVGALVWLVIAWLVLRADYASLATVGVLVGVVLALGMVTELGMATLASGGWRVLHTAVAFLYLLGALWGFIRPVATFFALASVLGLLLFLEGLFTLMRGLALRDESSTWWLDLVGGGLLIALAVWISTSDRVWTLGARAGFILVWVGFFALFRAFSALVVAGELRRLGRAADRPGAVAQAQAAGAVIPPQEQRTAADRMPQDVQP
jgi:uncharacterized membrane protein HdeD (DUF308 family)